MVRSIVLAVIVGLMGMSADGQPTSGGVPPSTTAVATSEPDLLARPELLRRIAMYEAVVQRAEAAHYSAKGLVQVYAQLGGMYYSAAMFAKSEDAMRQAIALLQDGPQDQLAAEISALARLHIAMGEVREAEREQLQALEIRESVGDPVGLALTWNDLAMIYIKEQKFKKALDYAQRAMVVIGDNPRVDSADRVAIRPSLGSALCEAHDYVRAIPMLKDALAVARSSFGPDSVSAAIASYILGYAYWQSGDMVDASTWMQQGTAGMKPDLGWGHPVYVDSMRQYARFLRAWGQLEAATNVEREVRQADAVVDARTLALRSSSLASKPSR